MSPLTVLLPAILVLAAGLVVFIILALRLRRFTPSRSYREEAAPASAALEYQPLPLLSPAERSFFGVLEHALPTGCRAFAKVRLADILRPADSPSRSGWQTAFNRISAKHVDFLLCETTTLKPIAAIELDDRSHSTFERGFRDNFLDEALSSAGIPLIRIPARRSYSPTELRQQLQRALPAHRPPAATT